MIKNDDGFICKNCGQTVEKLKYTSRNHCNHCLCSMHLDNEPGDRQNTCMGIMEPIDITIDGKKGYVIIHRCTKCGAIKRNKSAIDDDFETILKIMKINK